MAKAPVPEFNPYRAVTPASGMTDIYYQPNIFQVPDTGLGQIAEALRVLSPTLMTTINQQAAAENEEQAQLGQTEAARLNEEQARQASKGQFAQLEKDGVIPQGASPFRLAAMQASLGKRAVETSLLQTLNANAERLSDPYSQEDPAEFVQQEFVKATEGMGFYAQGAAAAALDNVERNFINRTSRLRGEKRSEQNRMDFVSDVYGSLVTPPPDDLDPAESLLYIRDTVQSRVDEHYTITGEPGRDELMLSLRAAVKELASDGDLEGATSLIDAIEGVKIGDRALSEDKRIEIANLRNLAEDEYESAKIQEDKEIARLARTRALAGENAKDHYFTSMDENDFRAANFKAMQADIIKHLQEVGGLSENDATLEAANVIQGLQADQKRVDADPEAIAALGMLIYDDSITPNEKIRQLAEYRNRIPSEEYGAYFTHISKTQSVNSTTQRLRGVMSQDFFAYRREIASLAEKAGLDNGLQISMALGGRFDQVISEIAAKGGDMPTQKAAVLEMIKPIFEDFKDAVSAGIEGAIPEGAPAEVQKQIEADRLRLLQEQELPPGSLTQKDTYWDEAFENDLLVIQNEKSSEEDKKAAQDSLYQNSLEHKKKLSAQINPTPGTLARLGGVTAEELVGKGIGLTDEQKGEDIISSSVIGFSLQEIKDKKTELGTDIPVEAFNPRHSILIPGMETPEQFREYAADEQNKPAIIEIINALPPEFRFGDPIEFIAMQYKVLKRYRASRATTTEDNK